MEPTEVFTGQRNSADVVIIDGLPPEEGAMSQSLYSRKPKSVLYHLFQVLKKGAKNFMSMFYSGYGHDSIGDCGSTTLYFENTSMLSAKSLQSGPLYNGQEASTRYLDFSGRIMINPLLGQLQTNHLYIAREMLTTDIAAEKIEQMFVSALPVDSKNDAGERGSYIQNKWMEFYERNMPIVRDYVKSENPIQEDQKEEDYEKSIKARAFDIMRAFIPAGMTTLVSWHSNLRQLRDRLAILKYHPSAEISRIAQTALMGLKSTYPASFEKKTYPETEEYLQLRAVETSYYTHREGEVERFKLNDLKFDSYFMERNYRHLLTTRPQKTEAPHELGECGVVNVKFPIDFGSFRDVHRHRKGVCKMPLLTTHHGFNSWYMERLPEQTRIEAEELLTELVPMINELPCDDIDRQYFISMGFNVIADFTWTFDQCIYVAELRSSETVHATLRVYAQELGKWIRKKLRRMLPSMLIGVETNGVTNVGHKI